MGKFKTYLLVPILGTAVLLTSCGSKEQNRAAVAPPMRAQAPTAMPGKTVPVPEKKIQEKVVLKTDPVESLIARAEREYEAGRANYNAGHLEAAKENFDRAFNILLQGPPEVRSNDRLEQEFDKIVEGTHNLELLALKEGDGFSEQPSEPAPIDEANAVTFPVDPNIRAKAEQELMTTQSDLPLTLNDAVASYISYFSNRGRPSLEHGYIRAGRYRPIISKILKEEGVPQDLIYLAQAESGFHPLALSRAGARGMWQFMAGRGEQYGLDRSWWLDDRQDPEKATRAAARHLKDLYEQFGDWYLAMAAYNSGPGTVQKAVQRTGYADYWELFKRGVLPAETRNYVPIILAITIMSKNPAQYGLDRLRTEEPVKYESVTVDYPVDLRLVAECVDSSLSTIQELNPALVRMTTPKNQQFALHVPVGTTAKYEEAIAAIPVAMRVSWHYHRVQPGDTLASVARKYRTTAQAIAEANNLEGEDIGRSTKLIIPVTPGKRAEGELAFAKKASRYKVRKGDTVLSVADDFGVPAENLRKWNRLKGNALKVGRVLLIHKPVAASRAATQASNGTSSRAKVVQIADSKQNAPRCTGWAKRQGKRVCVAYAKPKIAARSEVAQKGKKSGKPSAEKPVQLTGAKRSKAIAPSTVAKRKTGREEQSRLIRHRVKKGETLTSIANAYNTTVADLKRENGKIANLKAGTVLIIKSGN